MYLLFSGKFNACLASASNPLNRMLIISLLLSVASLLDISSTHQEGYIALCSEMNVASKVEAFGDKVKEAKCEILMILSMA